MCAFVYERKGAKQKGNKRGRETKRGRESVCVFASVCVFESEIQRTRQNEGEWKPEREQEAEGGELI